MQRHHATAWDFPLPNFSHSHHKHLLCSRSCAALQILLNTSYKLTWLLNFQSELNPFPLAEHTKVDTVIQKGGAIAGTFHNQSRWSTFFISNRTIHSCCMKLSVQRYEGYYHTARNLHLSTISLCAGINFDLLLCFEHHCIMSAHFHDVLLMLRIPFCTFILSKSS